MPTPSLPGRHPPTDAVYPHSVEWKFCLFSRCLRRLELSVYRLVKALFEASPTLQKARIRVRRVAEDVRRILLSPFYSPNNLSAQRSLARRRSDVQALRAAGTAPAPSDWPELDLSIVTYNSARWLEPFFASLLGQDYPLSRIHLHCVDNGSTDDSRQRVEALYAEHGGAFASVTLRRRENRGYGAGHNAALAGGSAPYCLVSNVDLEFFSDAITMVMRRALADAGSGVASWELRQLPREHPKHYDPVTLETNWSSHACILLRRSAFEKVGGYDENLFMYAEDVELSYRFRSYGYALHYAPAARVMHYAGRPSEQTQALRIVGGYGGNLYLRLRYGSRLDRVGGFLLCLRKLLDVRLSRKLRARLASELLRLWRAARKTPQARGSYPAAYPFYALDYEYSRGESVWAKRAGEHASRDPLVSVLIRCCAGRELFLRQALHCVFRQTWSRLEVIVSEDGGGGMEPLVRELADCAPAGLVLRYLRNPKVGRSAAGNAALNAASGEYCLFYDDDDLLYADHVETLMNALTGAYAGAYAPGTEAPTSRTGMASYREEAFRCAPELWQPWDYAVLRHHNFLLMHTLFKRACFLRHGGLDEGLEYFEDWNLWLRYGCDSPFAYVPRATSLFRTPADPAQRLARTRRIRAMYAQARHRAESALAGQECP